MNQNEESPAQCALGHLNGTLLQIVNTVRENKRQGAIESLSPEMRLREDLGFDSLDLAELTVRIDERFRVDVFELGLVNTVGEVVERLGTRI